jgi:hypothetical protein
MFVGITWIKESVIEIWVECQANVCGQELMIQQVFASQQQI